DHFKEANDQFGHETGDRLLASVADVMRQQVRATDIAGRLGGDEFALLLPNMGGHSGGFLCRKSPATFVGSNAPAALAGDFQHRGGKL
ncbi:MAG: GGDEF domain-containing protein, partial [Azonexus sp.]|nr:GGDEF domain-containing protein [Azonexus sp.]